MLKELKHTNRENLLSGIIYVLLFLLEKTCKYKELENRDTKINYNGAYNKSNMRIKV